MISHENLEFWGSVYNTKAVKEKIEKMVVTTPYSRFRLYEKLSVIFFDPNFTSDKYLFDIPLQSRDEDGVLLYLDRLQKTLPIFGRT